MVGGNRNTDHKHGKIPVRIIIELEYGRAIAYMTVYMDGFSGKAQLGTLC